MPVRTLSSGRSTVKRSIAASVINQDSPCPSCPPFCDRQGFPHQGGKPKVVADIRSWAQRQRSSPQSGLRKAIEYMFGAWSGLTLFLDDPAVPLDNNGTERGTRVAELF